MRTLPLIVAGLALVLAGCGGTPAWELPSSGDTGTAPSFSAPATLNIPSVNISADVRPIPLSKAKILDITSLDKEPLDAGWYDQSAKLGQVGPMVIAAHVNYNGPGAFGRLHQVKPGAQVVITGEDQTRKTYTVYKVESFKKSTFPTRTVYGNVDTPELRLITCGGVFDPSRRVGTSPGSYTDNIVAFAKLTEQT